MYSSKPVRDVATIEFFCSNVVFVLSRSTGYIRLHGTLLVPCPRGWGGATVVVAPAMKAEATAEDTTLIKFVFFFAFL